jgi:fructose-bisphosphate aldolase class II
LSYSNSIDILRTARDNKFAAGAFNVCSLDQTRGLIKLAEEAGSSILITIPGIIEPYLDFGELGEITRYLGELCTVPVGLHLSHGMDLGIVERAVDEGFTSVMFDGSKLSLEENINMTRQAVEIGHNKGVAVEGELGALGGSEDLMTDPEIAERYVKETGIDILAVAIGNAHGFYKGTPKLDFERLDRIKDALKSKKDIFLTLHGGTGIPDDDMKKAISGGITKICIYTEMCNESKENAMDYLARNPEYAGNFDLPDLFKIIVSGSSRITKQFMDIFGSTGKYRFQQEDKKPGDISLNKEDIEVITKRVIDILKEKMH